MLDKNTSRPEHRTAPVDQTAPADQNLAPLISARGISLIRGGKTYLHSIDLDVMPGEIVTLIGPNGAGKSTLIKLFLGLIQPTTGTIERKDNLHLGYVPQIFNIDKIIPMTVSRFVTLKQHYGPEFVLSALKKVGAEGLEDRQISDLSGGEVQRIMLARALIGEPELLILDEPVQGVDYVGEADLYRLIEAIRDELGCGILLVSHDLHIVMAASDRIVCLNQHVCCSGKPDSVAKHPEYRKLFGTGRDDAIALYTHRHDHHHDISGSICEGDEEAAHSGHPDHEKLSEIVDADGHVGAGGKVKASESENQ